MDTINILLLVIGWLLISCGVARVLGGLCDLGETSVEGWNDINVESNPPSLTGDDYCLGLILECVAAPPTTYFPVLFQRYSCAWTYVPAPPV
jgi:hypothetical protein